MGALVISAILAVTILIAGTLGFMLPNFMEAEAGVGCRRQKRLRFAPGSGRSPGGGRGNPYSILAWTIPRTEEPGGLQAMGLQRVRHD